MTGAAPKRAVARRPLTQVEPVLRVEGTAGAEVDSAADHVAGREGRAVHSAGVVGVIGMAVVSVITIRVRLPPRRSC